MGIIVFIGISFAVFAIYRIRIMFSLKHKFSNFVKYCSLYGYSFKGYYKNIGLEYRKEISIYKITHLFENHNINPTAFPENSKIVEHLVIVDFPSYERRYYDAVEFHGGTRLFHFYSIFIKTKNGYECLPYEKRYIEDFKGCDYNIPKHLTGVFLDNYIKNHTKDALLKLVDDAKYWNGGEKVIDKYKELIQLFTTAHKEFIVCDEAPNEVNLTDYKSSDNHVTIILSQKYEENNIDKKITVTILKWENPRYFQIDKSFKEDENQSTIFYSFNNECIKGNYSAIGMTSRQAPNKA